MVNYTFTIQIEYINHPSHIVGLNVGDKISGEFSFDINSIPASFNGCDDAIPYGFTGECIINKTTYKLNSFCLSQSHLLRSVLFFGDIDFTLNINFEEKSFVLQGNDFEIFEYSGSLTDFHVTCLSKFILRITQINQLPPSHTMLLDIGDEFNAQYYVDTGAVPNSYVGCDSAEPFGFSGEVTIDQTLFKLASFCINSSQTFTSIIFDGDIEYTLSLDLIQLTFSLTGSDIYNFDYSGEIIFSTNTLKKPTGLKVTDA